MHTSACANKPTSVAGSIAVAAAWPRRNGPSYLFHNVPSRTQEQLPDVGVAETFDVFPHLADQVAVAGDFGKLLHLLFPRPAEARLHAWRGLAGHAGNALPVGARAGHRCVIFEQSKFPRYHIGESLIPHTHGIFDLLGLLPQLRASAFPVKHSVRFVSHGGKESVPFYFAERFPEHRAALIDCLIGDVIKEMSAFTAALAQMTPPPPPLGSNIPNPSAPELAGV